MQYQLSDPVGLPSLACRERSWEVLYRLEMPFEVTYTNDFGQIVTTSYFYFGYCLTPFRLHLLYLLALIGLVLIAVYLTRFRIVRAADVRSSEVELDDNHLDELADIFTELSRESNGYLERTEAE